MFRWALLVVMFFSLTLQASMPPNHSADRCESIEYGKSYPQDYEKYPGIAYERSLSTAQVVTAVVVGIAFVATVAVLLVNTPHGHHHNHHH